MFINLSNHSSKGWTPSQLKASSIYGEIRDEEFPPISPEWDSDQVKALAEKYVLKCISLIDDSSSNNAFHIAGEPTFCFLLIQALLNKGYTVFTSTTNRIVYEVGDKKISTFNFVKFRKYVLWNKL